jgi:S1-C subfamily serine protease
MPPGSSVKVTVRRSGQEMDIPVTVGRRPAESDG